MKKKLLAIVLLVIAVAQLYAQPANYYQSALGKNGSQLKTALHNIIDNHSSLTFPLWSAFGLTDNKGSNQLWDIYSDIPGGVPNYTYTIGTDQCGQYNGEGDCYNHEHLWPKTYFNDASPMNSDLHHVYPVDGWVNNKRGSLPFGMVTSSGTYTSSNGSKVGASNTYTGYTGAVFQPIEDFRGDIARVYFYMSTRYEGEDASWANWEMANKAQLTSDAIQLLLDWHHADTVSQKEIARNNAVYNIQGNRNPFIDYPIFADCIWGSSDCKPLESKNIFDNRIAVYPNPATDYIIVDVYGENQSLNCSYELFSMQGAYRKGFTNRRIQTKELPRGIYALRIVLNNKVYTTSFVKY